MNAPRKTRNGAGSAWISNTLWTVSWIIAGFSAWTSASGLRAFFGASSANEQWSLWLFFVVVAAAFHIVAVIAFVIFRKQGLVRGLLIYLVLSFTAIALSYGWHWQHANARASAGEQYDTNRTEIARALITAHESFGHVVTTLELLKNYSAAAARTEASTGGTCGGPPRPKPGVRYQFRMDDKDAFETLALLAKRRQEQLAKLLAEFQALPVTAVDTKIVVPQMIKIADQFAALTGDDRLVADIRRQIEERYALARNGIGMENNKPVFCPDLKRDTLLKGVIEATRAPKVSLRHVLNPDSPTETQKAAWRRLNPASMRFEDWQALAAASLVEFALFSIMMLIPRRRSFARHEFDNFDELAATNDWMNVDALRRLAQQYGGDDLVFIRLIEEHLFWDRILWRRTPVLAVPVNSDVGEHRTLRVIAAAFVRCDMATRPWTPDWYFRMRLWLRWGDKPLRRLARRCELTFYKLEPEIWETIMIALAMTRPEPNPTDPHSGRVRVPLLPYFGPQTTT